MHPSSEHQWSWQRNDLGARQMSPKVISESEEM